MLGAYIIGAWVLEPMAKSKSEPKFLLRNDCVQANAEFGRYGNRGKSAKGKARELATKSPRRQEKPEQRKKSRRNRRRLMRCCILITWGLLPALCMLVARRC